MIKKIQEHIQTAQSRQKSYANKRRRPLEFDVGDRVLLKVSPTKGIRRFRLRLSPRYIRPYEITEKLDPVVYQLNLLVDLEHVHNMFHVSQLGKYIPNPNHAIVTEPIAITMNLTYEEHPVQVLDHRIK